MKTTATKSVQKAPSEETLAFLNNSFPVDDRRSGRLTLPRLTMLSKDLTEKVKDPKTKKQVINLIQPAGTFYIERQGEEEVEIERNGKKVKVKPFVKDFFEGVETIDAIIYFQRKQLRFFDEGTNKWISSPIYDTADQVVPLWMDGKEIHRGTPEQLRSLYPKLTAKGKPSSKLNEEAILYIIYEGEAYQMNISQSSKWEFSDYKKAHHVASVVTTIGSSSEKNGSNEYSKMTFEEARSITADEAELAVEKVKEVMASIESDKAFFSAKETEDALDKDQKELAGASVEEGTAKKGKDF